ncbi:CLUMA_CG020189, isoform A [Clunio marinus]|uniref:protein-tyrosine-phosphatase n=1 Tax=Clunio marinus TaxID=568069 RepID=A0A1J1J6V2_9DIPT|nr:CLUMA_CG020189, isoform A [Clunio marinus]
MLENMENFDLDPELCECTRLISNTFVINSAGISPSSREMQQHARGVQNRSSIAPTQINFGFKCDSPIKENNMFEDISFYSSNNPVSSPQPCPISPCREELNLLSPDTSPSVFIIDGTMKRLPRSYSHDASSRDSGYCGFASDSNIKISSDVPYSCGFQFIEPKRPETLSSSSPASFKTPSKYSKLNFNMSKNFKVFHSLSSESTESMDDDMDMELLDMESLDEKDTIPNDLCSLISKDIRSTLKTPERKKHNSVVRKCLDMEGSTENTHYRDYLMPKSSTITSLITTPERQCLQQLNENITVLRSSIGSFKRPDPPTTSPIMSKRIKTENEPPVPLASIDLAYNSLKRPVFRKSMSLNDAGILSALSRSSSEPNLIGDLSKPFCLPLIEGKHADLKSISSTTLQRLLNGKFRDYVRTFKIIDCRYPYEYEGGHIIGAVNLFTQEQILDEFLYKRDNIEQNSSDDSKRDILIFHCEFSSERGPKLSRYLRDRDRKINESNYPNLNFPEIYLLHGGYKDFFETYSDLCDPIAYRRMDDSQFSEQYKQFRAKSKSWTGDIRSTNKLTKSRSRLVL